MATTGEALATQVKEANGKLLSIVEGMSESQWKKPCKDETWAAGVTAHHVAESLGTLTGLVQAVATDAPVPAFTADGLNQMNAEHAVRAANVGREETATLLRDNIGKATSVIGGLSDAQLQKTAQLPVGPMTITQIVEGILVNHATTHAKSIADATT